MSATRCEPKTRNTASSRCKYDWGLFCRIVVTPRGKIYTGLDTDGVTPITFDEWIMKGIHAARRADRFYPMPYFSDSVSTSEDKTTWTNGYGQTFVIKEGNKGLTQSYNQDFCLSNRLATFNDGIIRRAIVFDNKSKAWGGGKSGGWAGYETNIFATTADITQPSEISEPKIDYTFIVPAEFADKQPMDTDLNIVELEGLEDVNMVIVKKNTTTEIYFYTDCGEADVTAEMAAISGERSCWIMDGTPMPLSAPTFEDGRFVISNNVLTGTELTLATPDILYRNGLAFKECQNIVQLT